MDNPFAQIAQRLSSLEQLLKDVKENQQREIENQGRHPEDPFGKYVAKRDITPRYLAQSTVYHMEQNGRLRLFAVGGKRYYLREDVERLFVEMNINED